MIRPKKTVFITSLVFVSIFVSCISPNGIVTDMAAIRHELKQKADSSVVAKNVESLTQEVNQISKTTSNLVNWKETINADTINYGGAGWVVLGLILMVMVFLSAIGLFLYFVFKYIAKYKGMLSLVTTAIHKSSPKAIEEVKKQINKHAYMGGAKQQINKVQLSKHCRREGIFARED